MDNSDYDSLVVGSGFSAYCADAFLKQLDTGRHKVISPKDHLLTSQNKYHHHFTFNRLLAPKAKSVGSSSWKVPGVRLVDRVTLGGNMNIWGGYIDLDLVDFRYLDVLSGMTPIKVTSDLHGIDSNRNLGVLTNDDGTIFNGGTALNSNLINEYVTRMELLGDKTIKLFSRYYDQHSTYQASVIFLCLGVVQLLELLSRSNLLRSGDRIKIHEHSYQLAYGTQIQESILSDCDTYIRYKFPIAVGRRLGSRRLDYGMLNRGPYVVSQLFQKTLQSVELVYQQDEKCFSTVSESKVPRNFGSSIHYFGVEINSLDINTFFQERGLNVFSFGHGSISPGRGGPISNYIINDIGKHFSL
jgi:hypothetical protein